jgi:hypothetical protein
LEKEEQERQEIAAKKMAAWNKLTPEERQLLGISK